MDIDEIFTNLVDLHVHLGSSSTPHFLWEMAHEQGIKLPTKNYWEFIDSVTMTENKTYEEYLNYFHLSELIQSSLFAVEKAVHHAISLSYRKANITTLEIRFNPMLRNRNDESDLDKIILAALIGMKKAVLEYPVKVGLILMMDRRFSAKKNAIIAQKAIRFKNDGILGIDIGGPMREGFTVDEVVPAFLNAKENGLKTTFHTGEVTGPEEMWEVVEKIGPDRIGHGVQSVQDPKLLDYLAEKKIPLEVCPTSNLRISLFKKWEEFKGLFEKFDKHGVLYTINSDNPVLLQTNVKNELKKLLEHKVLTKKDITKLTQRARDLSFIK